MSALTRMRRLAAALTLLLFVTTTSLAGIPGRPIDRPEGPPEPNPTEIGDPDAGHGGLPMYIQQLILAAQLSSPGLRSLATAFLKFGRRTSTETRQALHGGNPR